MRKNTSPVALSPVSPSPAHDLKLTIDLRRHAFGAATVLEGIHLELNAGEIVAIIGPSGCGKSTLLSIVGGLMKPTDGNIYYTGELPAECLNPFTYIFQDFALLPWQTTYQNVAYALGHHGLTAQELNRRVNDALQRTGLEDFADLYPRQLSGGMRQRVGIARALAVRPAVLLMDEPLSALDAQTRDLLMQDFLNLWLQESVTGIYVTHNLDEAVKLANRIVVLSRRPGRIKEIVDVPIPQTDRELIENAAPMAALRDRLWSLIKEEAIIANKERLDG